MWTPTLADPASRRTRTRLLDVEERLVLRHSVQHTVECRGRSWPVVEVPHRVHVLDAESWDHIGPGIERGARGEPAERNWPVATESHRLGQAAGGVLANVLTRRSFSRSVRPGSSMRTEKGARSANMLTSTTGPRRPTRGSLERPPGSTNSLCSRVCLPEPGLTGQWPPQGCRSAARPSGFLPLQLALPRKGP